MHVLEVIKKKRLSRNLTQEEMGHNLGMAKETYRNIENGKIRLKADDLVRICEILDISPSTIFPGLENRINLNEEEIKKLKEALPIIEKIINISNIKKEEPSKEVNLSFADSSKDEK